jgi:hypothetical protein
LVSEIPGVDERASQQTPSLVVILCGNTATAAGEAGETAASLKKAGAEQDVDQSLDIIDWTVTSIPHNPDDALFRNPWRRMGPNCSQRLGKPPKPHCSEPAIDLVRHAPSPSK